VVVGADVAEVVEVIAKGLCAAAVAVAKILFEGGLRSYDCTHQECCGG
jgi:hypothetical protein